MALSRGHKIAASLFLLLASTFAVFALARQLHPTGKPDAPGTHRTSKPIDITARAIALDDKQTRRVGALRYRAGYVLTAHAPESWGGWSGMVIAGNRLTAISDRGIFLQATLDLQNPKALLQNARYTRSFNEYGAGKIGLDAESIVPHPEGFLVGFEQYHRVALVRTPGHQPSYPAAFKGIDFSSLPSNGGLEAMTRSKSSDMILLAEGGKDTRGMHPAWVVRPDGSHRRSSYKPPRDHAPTAAVTLESGDMVVLNRAFSPLSGNSIKLSHIDAADVGAEIMVGRTIAHLTPDMNIDNFEALAVKYQENGPPLLLMLSDDNFNSAQRTILLVFELAL